MSDEPRSPREDPRPALILLAAVIGAFVLFIVAVHVYWYFLERNA